MNKKYWLRGLVIGIIVFILFIIILGVNFQSQDGGRYTFMAILITIPVILPIIPLGLLIGWIYGKTKK